MAESTEPTETVDTVATERSGSGAAFFDLDRTLLAGASGPAISAALRAVGLMGERSIPGQDLVFRAFNAFGETRPSMMLTRQAASLAARWPRSAAQEAGRLAAETLVELVQPYAPDAIVEYVSRKEDPRDYRVSFTKIATRLGFEITIPVADGVAEVARLVEAGIVPGAAIGAAVP
jgi:putative phosphoserine phosphatase/1-acylglycerol-3-phosphate O-acyltransferase